MSEFLKLHSLAEAKRIFFQHFLSCALTTEKVKTKESLGRYVASSVLSREFLPPFTRSSMDGYAIRAADSHGASEGLPAFFKIMGEVLMGESPKVAVGNGEAVLIHTGGMLPKGADAVVILENTQKIGLDELEIYKAVTVNENVLIKGEDVKPGDVVIPAGKRIRPQEIGGLLALGITTINVAKQPRVAVLTCGDELVPPEENPRPGQVRDINSQTLTALVRESGGIVTNFPIIPDQLEQMRSQVRQAFDQSDAVVIAAGSSVSVRDMTAAVISELGEPGILVHGINIRPGKPTILAVCSGKPVIGLPGNPVSALVIANLFVKPLLAIMQGMVEEPIEPIVHATLTTNLGSSTGREEWLPTRLIKKDCRIFAEPIFFKSNYIFQLSAADGLLLVEADVNGIEAGTEVEVMLFQR